jgi:Penicillin-binding Protein dimerisation domain./Penicillin binding protein transpeptidase domain.
MENVTVKVKKFTSRMQARLLLVFCVVTLLLAGLIGRLVYIMETDGERYAKQVLSRQTYVSSVLPYKRGEILDRNGTVLARSELRYRLILDPENLLLNSDKIPTTLKALKDYYQIDEETVNAILDKNPNSRYKVLLDNLQLSQIEEFKNLLKEDSDITGLWFEEKYVRVYPYDTLACDVIGFTSSDNRGFFGIEEYYNDELNGTNGREYGYYDSTLNIERIVKKPQNGNSVVSTIDVNAQRIIQKHIREFNEEFGSKSIGVLVMDPNSGEIIAMASNQEFNLNSPRDLEGIYSEEELANMTAEEKVEAMNEIWKNDIISSGYEPGSTFKPFTVAIALEEALVSQDSTFFCDGGEHVGGWHIRCSSRSGHGELTLAEALMKSCNDAMMQIVKLEGKDLFYKYQTNFSFGRKTGIDLPGEENGIIISLDKLNASELATSSFGQSFNVTMLQMAAAFSSLVNGGFYYQPHVVKEIMNDQKATVKKIEPMLVRRTVSDETSKFIREALYQTVEMGTAKPAKVEGYAIGGKTGTAEKYPRRQGKYVVSFLGAVPALSPEIVIYVVIDEPQNVPRQDDSSIATKFASRIMKELLPALGIYPEGEIDYLLDGEGLRGENVGDETGAQIIDETDGDITEEPDEGTPDNAGQSTDGGENTSNDSNSNNSGHNGNNTANGNSNGNNTGNSNNNTGITDNGGNAGSDNTGNNRNNTISNNSGNSGSQNHGNGTNSGSTDDNNSNGGSRNGNNNAPNSNDNSLNHTDDNNGDVSDNSVTNPEINHNHGTNETFGNGNDGND